MSSVQIVWDPHGFELNSIGTNQLLRITDGDTPFIAVSVRMLSIDTPEVHYPGNQSPARQDEHFAQLAEWLIGGQAPVEPDLAAHLHPRLASGSAGTLHARQGEQAATFFRELTERLLKRPSGTQRSVFLRAADRPFDRYGRLLAYVAPALSREELELLSREDRATFNLRMIAAGWAAAFPIYPSLPSYPDLVLLHRVAQNAYTNRLGAWAEPLLLTGYEFRMCVRLYQVTQQLVAGARLSSAERGSWLTRSCVDLTTRELHAPQQYAQVPPPNRLFIEPQDLAEAVGRLNLVPAALP